MKEDSDLAEMWTQNPEGYGVAMIVNEKAASQNIIKVSRNNGLL